MPKKKKKKSIRKPDQGRWEALRAVWNSYSQLFPYVKPYRARFVLGILAGAGAGMVSGLLGLVIKHVSDQVFPGGGAKGGIAAALKNANAGPSIEAVMWICAAIPAVMILRSILNYSSAYCMAWVSLKVLTDLRTALFGSIMRQSLDFFNKERAGNLITRVANDSRVAQTALTQVSSSVVVQPFTIISAITMLLHLDWKFTVISLVLFPVCLVPIIFYGRKVRRSGKNEEEGVGAFMVILTEALAGIKIIKSLAREVHEVQKFDESSREQFKHAIRVRKSMEIVGPIIEAVSAVGVGMALLYVYSAHLSAGTFLGLLTGLFMLYDPVKNLSRLHVQMQKCLNATERIFDVMKQQPTVQDDPEALAIKSTAGELRLENVTFTYQSAKNKVPAVNEMSLHVEPGKTYALVGESGSGKSTTLALLLRFYDPLAGRILLDGVDIRQITQRSLREQISIVTQDTFLFHDTIYNNILYGRLDASKEEVYRAAAQAYAHEFIELQSEGYQTVIGDKGCMLSGGQQQRLAIARALLKNAPILLLDEATSALDSESEHQIQAALETLSTGRTVIAIAHRLSTILKADKIVVMDSGFVREVGTHQELLEKSGIYRRLYDLQFNSGGETQAETHAGVLL